MSNQNSSLNNIIRPEELITELGVSKATYYEDLSYLGIKASKDENKKAYLTFDEAQQVRALRSHVNEYGKRNGFVYKKVEDESNIGSSIITTTSNDIETAPSNLEAETAIATAENITTATTGELAQQEIYVGEAETDPTNEVDLDRIYNNAQELAARNMSIADLISVQMAAEMTYDDLSDELKKKVDIAKEAANPKKYQPGVIAQSLLEQRRKQKVC